MTVPTPLEAREAFRKAAAHVADQDPVTVVGLTWEEIQEELGFIAGEPVDIDDVICFTEGMLVGMAFKS